MLKCSRKTLNALNVPIAVTAGDNNGPTGVKQARSMLCDCPWRVRFKKQLNGSWILTQLVDQHERHQLEGLNPLAYPENRPMTPEAKETMISALQVSSAPLSTIGSIVNTSYGPSLLDSDVYNRT
ncbi:hypothetical protein V1507DRAFT_392688 [Lipomyces tetrasporus]